MKILFIDAVSSAGHAVFNRIQLTALTSLGHAVTGLFRGGYDEAFAGLPVRTDIALPRWLYPWFVKGRFLHSLFGVIRLWWIWWRTRGEEQDAVVISLYTPMALQLLPPWRRVYVFDHRGTVVDGRFARGCLRRRRNVTHLVFEAASAAHFRKHGIARVEVVPHGFLPLGTATKGEMPEWIPEAVRGRRWIFCPSVNSTVDRAMVRQVLKDPALVAFLEARGLTLILRRNYDVVVPPVTVLIRREFLSREDYCAVFSRSLAIWLPYAETFCYRSSGVLCECMAAGKPCVASDIPAFRSYERHMAHPLFHRDSAGFRERLEELLRLEQEGASVWWQHLEELNPASAWERLLGKGGNEV